MSKTRTQKTLAQMTDSEVLAMALDEMEVLGLIKWKQATAKKPTIDENPEARGERQVSSDLILAERSSRASFADGRSLDDQVRHLLEQAARRPGTASIP